MSRRKAARMALIAGPVVLLLALVATLGWSHTLHSQRLVGWHVSMMRSTAAAPDQYRVLTPVLANAVFSFLPQATPQEVMESIGTAYNVLHLAAFAAALGAFWAFCAGLLGPFRGALGPALLSALAGVSNLPGCIQVTDPLNLAFVCASLLVLQRRRWGHLLWLVPLAAVNRESALIIAGYSLLFRWPDGRWRAMGECAVLVVLWAAAYGALRATYGDRAYTSDVVMLSYNVGSVSRIAWPAAYLVPWLALAATGASAKPRELARCAWLALPYIALHFVIARPEEVRLFLPLLPVLVPLALLTLQERLGPDGEGTEGDTAGSASAAK